MTPRAVPPLREAHHMEEGATMAQACNATSGGTRPAAAIMMALGRTGEMTPVGICTTPAPQQGGAGAAPRRIDRGGGDEPALPARGSHPPSPTLARCGFVGVAVTTRTRAPTLRDLRQVVHPGTQSRQDEERNSQRQADTHTSSLPLERRICLHHPVHIAAGDVTK